MTGVPQSASESWVRESIESFEGCFVDEVRLVRDAKTGKSKGFAYVQMNSKEAHTKAIKIHKFCVGSTTLNAESMKSKEHQRKH